MKRKYLFIYILFICYISCKHSEIVEHKGFIINETIITTCTNDTNHKYIVYLPNQYDSTPAHYRQRKTWLPARRCIVSDHVATSIPYATRHEAEEA